MSADLGVPCPLMAPLWVDQCLVGRVAKRHPNSKLENVNRFILQHPVQHNSNTIVKVVCVCVRARVCLRRPSTDCVRGVCQRIPPLFSNICLCVCGCVIFGHCFQTNELLMHPLSHRAKLHDSFLSPISCCHAHMSVHLFHRFRSN